MITHGKSPFRKSAEEEKRIREGRVKEKVNVWFLLTRYIREYSSSCFTLLKLQRNLDRFLKFLETFMGVSVEL